MHNGWLIGPPNSRLFPWLGQSESPLDSASDDGYAGIPEDYLETSFSEKFVLTKVYTIRTRVCFSNVTVVRLHMTLQISMFVNMIAFWALSWLVFWLLFFQFPCNTAKFVFWKVLFIPFLSADVAGFSTWRFLSWLYFRTITKSIL